MSARYSGSNFDARVLRASICVDGSQGWPPCDPTIHANDECCWGTAHAKRLPLRLRSSPDVGNWPASCMGMPAPGKSNGRSGPGDRSVGEVPHGYRQRLVALPEGRGGAVDHGTLDRPAAWSFISRRKPTAQSRVEPVVSPGSPGTGRKALSHGRNVRTPGVGTSADAPPARRPVPPGAASAECCKLQLSYEAAGSKYVCASSGFSRIARRQYDRASSANSGSSASARWEDTTPSSFLARH